MSKSYISIELRQQVRSEGRFRRGYCLTPELWYHGDTMSALDMNREGIVVARSFWVQAGWHPPED